MTLLVVGAAKHSLGAAVVKKASKQGISVITAGLHKQEDFYLNVLEHEDEAENWLTMMSANSVTDVVCTVGLNDPAQEGGSLGHPTFPEWLTRSFMVNVVGPMALCKVFLDHLRNNDIEGSHYVAISSNSAHIARSNSMAYCSSKAALSMALRVAAREIKGHPASIYGYELGLLQSTPMTKVTEKRFGPAQTRMPGAPHGLDTGAVAAQIVSGLQGSGQALNGILMRLDAGEQ